MMVTITSGFGANSLNLSAKANFPDMDACLNVAKSQGRSRAIQRDVVLQGSQSQTGIADADRSRCWTGK